MRWLSAATLAMLAWGIAGVPAGHAADSTTKSFRDCAACPLMRVIPAGTFTMGSPASEEGRLLTSGAEGNPPPDENREQQHSVSIAKAFALAQYPVTKKSYAQFVAASHYQPQNECFSSDKAGPGGHPSAQFTWDHPGFFTQADDEPAICISGIDALAYVAWLSRKSGKVYRLPSEAEWEYAARAGSATSRYWGDSQDEGCPYANGIGTEASKVFDGAPTKCDDGFEFTSPVGSYKPNAFGLYDMLGNVWQWMQDCWHPNYTGAPIDGSPWGEEPNCKRSVLRGGSFVSNYTSVRAAARHEAWPASRIFNYGFRVARSL